MWRGTGWASRVMPLLAALLAVAAPAAFAQDEEPPLSVTRLAEEFSDPLTTLPQLFLQDAYTPSNYGIDASTNRVIARLIVPRLPRYSLFPFVQLVRPSLSLVTVPEPGGGTRTEFGDMQLFDLAVIPWPGKESGLIMGVGPVFVFPTATNRIAGQGAWQVGPAFGAIYKGLPEWLFGCLIQDPISFAYTSSTPSARRRPDGPADPVPPRLARAVRQVGGRELGVQLAPGLVDHPAAQLRGRLGDRPRRVVADQPVRQRRVDGVSTRRPRGSADDRPVRHDDRLPAVAAVVVRDGAPARDRG